MSEFLLLQFQAFLIVMILMTAVWMVSVFITNASIVDIFWGLGFLVAASYYFLHTDGYAIRKIITLVLVSTWGLRLSFYVFWRNLGKGEDYRYQNFRKDYGEKRYWWFSFFQVFLLQGFLLTLISAPLLGAQINDSYDSLTIFDYLGILFWIIGFVFEAGSDIQLAIFKSNQQNKGKLLTTGFWKFTRHPNYFGDAAVWWGFGFLSIAGGAYIPALGSVLMTFLLLRVSGVSMLERSLKNKPGYQEYAEKTSAFIPWFPKK